MSYPHDNIYTPKSREEYIAQCLFYNGNNDFNSYGFHRSIAIRECWWVDAHYDSSKLNDLREQIKQYKAFGLGHFHSKDGVPIALKTVYWLLWLKECEGMGTAEDFKEAYRRILLEYGTSKCRYYRGEKKCPTKITNKSSNGAFYWETEMFWVSSIVDEHIDTGAITEYDAYVIPDVSETFGIPKSLLALIFIRVGKWSYSMENCGEHFSELIENGYMSYLAPSK